LSATVLPLFIPSPSQGVWHIGPFPIRGYALCIILGVVVAIWVGERRWPARGGVRGQVSDIAIWAVPFGLVGGRLYHVITDPARYFGRDGDPIAALYVWQGGLGIWGAIALGGVGAWIGCRRMGIKLPPLADALAPGIVLAQAIGRWGNWFNQELYGKPTTLPWGLKIDEKHRVPGYERFETFHPTYLYECLWDLGTAGLVIWADRRFRLGHGRAFALYVIAYTAGRGWIEALRIDTVEANDVFGLRLNVWTSIVLFLGAAAYFVVMGRLRPGREESVWREGREPEHPAPELGAEGDSESRSDDSDAADKPGTEDDVGPGEGRQPGPAGRSGEPDLR
jgi:prolipoprotein diacylglyceryl transferase